jgi:superfamily II RNA helicase
MQFEYSFILKALNGSVAVNTLLGDSYWWALEQEEGRMLLTDINDLQKKQDSLQFSEEELAVCREKKVLEDTIANSHNAKRKQATREYENWKQDHKESIWGWIFQKFSEYDHLERKKSSLQASYAAYQRKRDALSLMEVPEVLQRFRVLEGFQYVSRTGETFALTDKGYLSSECNEGHSFLLTEYMLYLHDKISIGPSFALHDVLVALSLFLGEAKDEVTRASTDGAAAEHIEYIREKAAKGYALEQANGITYKGFWDLNEEWIEPMQAWLTGQYSLAEIANTYQLFEGAVQKAVLKLAAILEELQAMATLHTSVDLLRFLEDGRNLIVQDSILAESLYLRI